MKARAAFRALFFVAPLFAASEYPPSYKWQTITATRVVLNRRAPRCGRAWFWWVLVGPGCARPNPRDDSIFASVAAAGAGAAE
jgi:hypothetical protein